MTSTDKSELIRCRIQQAKEAVSEIEVLTIHDDLNNTAKLI